MLSEKEYVSLCEIRVWKDGVDGDFMGMASSGVVLFNRKDVCLGGMDG